MIRINLLETERAPSKKKAAAGPPGATQVYLMLGVFVVGALGVCAVGWWLKSSAIAELDAQTAQVQRRKTELDKIAQEVAKYEAQKKLLEDKLRTIATLKGQQTNAIHLLDEISKALPDFVWLATMQQTGNGLRFVGKSNSLNAVADFQENLLTAAHPPPDQGDQKPCTPTERQGCWFATVDLGNTTETNRVVDFILSANFQPPPPPPLEGTEAAATE